MGVHVCMGVSAYACVNVGLCVCIMCVCVCVYDVCETCSRLRLPSVFGLV